MEDEYLQDEILKAHFDRQQQLGKLLQNSQNRMGEYEIERLDANDPAEKNKFKRRIEDIQKDINEYLEEVRLLDQKIEERRTSIQSLKKLYSTKPRVEHQEDLQFDEEIGDFVFKIQSPFIRELEIRLRGRSDYWKESNFPLPGKSEQYTASYFSSAWKKLESFGDQLQSSDCERQKLILEQVGNQFFQISNLIKGITQYELSATLEIELSRVQNEIEVLRSTVRKIQSIKLDGSKPPTYLFRTLDAKTASLKISLKEFQNQFQKLIDQAHNASSFYD